MKNILLLSQHVFCIEKWFSICASSLQMEPVVVMQDCAHFPNAPP
jgi:hypothetical protein